MSILRKLNAASARVSENDPTRIDLGLFIGEQWQRNIILHVRDAERLINELREAVEIAKTERLAPLYHWTPEDRAILFARDEPGHSIALDLVSGDCIDFRAMKARPLYARALTRMARTKRLKHFRFKPEHFVDYEITSGSAPVEYIGPRTVRQFVEKILGEPLA